MAGDKSLREPARDDAAVGAGEAPESILIGPRKLAVRPAGQRVEQIGAAIKLTRFDDIDAYHPMLIKRILDEEAVLRRESPPPTRCLGGQKVRKATMMAWDCPAFELINERAKALFRLSFGGGRAVVDAVWANVYRRWESIGPHSHRRTAASLAYTLDAGDPDPDCELSGKFSFVDPRLEICCQLEKGHMTNPYYPEMPAGTLMIFPGQAVHCVSAYAGTRPRITLAWNINPTELEGSIADIMR
jgi:hypothetical protein